MLSTLLSTIPAVLAAASLTASILQARRTIPALMQRHDTTALGTEYVYSVKEYR